MPLDLAVPADAGEVVRLLADIWIHANPDQIGSDLERARRLAAEAEPKDAELAQRYVAELSRLERWLRDV